jgi:subtilisin family serine protease
MKNHFFITLALIVLCSSAFAADEFAPGEILVKFRTDALSVGQAAGEMSAAQVSVNQDSVKALNMKHGLKAVKPIGRLVKKFRRSRSGKTLGLPDTSNIYLLKFTGDDTQAILNDYLNDPNVEMASLNYRRKALTVPNDPFYASSQQWALQKIHLTPQGAGTSGWDMTTGASSVKVAIIDSGVNYTHEDLVGKVDSLEGYNFVSMDADPMDDYGHGTHCAGIAGAVSNNGLGIAGVDWSSIIIPIKVLDSSGS